MTAQAQRLINTLARKKDEPCIGAELPATLGEQRQTDFVELLVVVKRILTILLAASGFLPIILVVLIAVERLLGALGDEAGAAALRRIGLAGGIVWIVTLIALLLALAIQAIESPPSGD